MVRYVPVESVYEVLPFSFETEVGSYEKKLQFKDMGWTFLYINRMQNQIHNRERILSLIGSYRVTQALALGASLGVFDRLKQPKSLKTISLELRLNSVSLKRLLDLYIELHLLIKVRTCYRITKSGEWLCSDVEGSLKKFAKLMGADWYWGPWSKIEESMRTGKSAFFLHHGIYPLELGFQGSR